MKRFILIFSMLFLVAAKTATVQAQCAMCTKTAQQLGEKPAKSLNNGIIYLMLTPFTVIGVIGYRWWKNNKSYEAEQ